MTKLPAVTHGTRQKDYEDWVSLSALCRNRYANSSIFSRTPGSAQIGLSRECMRAIDFTCFLQSRLAILALVAVDSGGDFSGYGGDILIKALVCVNDLCPDLLGTVHDGFAL